MATNIFIGKAALVAEVRTGSIDSVDATPANNVFTVTIGGVAISVTGTVDVNTTATALRAALNLPTTGYFSAITWGGTGGNIVGTMDISGMKFVAALTVTGVGSGSVTDFTVTTAGAGPNVYTSAGNWSLGAAPVATNDVILGNCDVDICWDLDQSAVNLNSFRKLASFTGRIGLNPDQFAQSADGHTTYDDDFAEYRGTYLQIGLAASKRADIEEEDTLDGGKCSPMCRINFGTSDTPYIAVHQTCRTAALAPRPAVQLLVTHANASVDVRNDGSGVGIASDPGETSTVGTLRVMGDNGHVITGKGLTVTTVVKDGGHLTLNAAATITTVTHNAGTMVTEGDYTISTMHARGGKVTPNHVKTGGAAITALNILDGAFVDGTQGGAARTWTTVTLNKACRLKVNNSIVTMTTLALAAGKEVDIKVT